MRLIDAKDCEDLMYVRCMGQDKKFIAAMKEVIDNTPTIDAEPIRYVQREKVPYCKRRKRCSECKNYAPSFEDGSENLTKFCPCCGSKMEEEESK